MTGLLILSGLKFIISLQKNTLWYSLNQEPTGCLPKRRLMVSKISDSLLIPVATVPGHPQAKTFWHQASCWGRAKLWCFPEYHLWLLAVLLLLGLIYAFFAKKEEERKKKLPPFERAIEELANFFPLLQEEYKQYYSRLTDVVGYLEEEAKISALESTTMSCLVRSPKTIWAVRVGKANNQESQNGFTLDLVSLHDLPRIWLYL